MRLGSRYLPGPGDLAWPDAAETPDCDRCGGDYGSVPDPDETGPYVCVDCVKTCWMCGTDQAVDYVDADGEGDPICGPCYDMPGYDEVVV